MKHKAVIMAAIRLKDIDVPILMIASDGGLNQKKDKHNMKYFALLALLPALFCPSVSKADTKLQDTRHVSAAMEVFADGKLAMYTPGYGDRNGQRVDLGPTNNDTWVCSAFRSGTGGLFVCTNVHSPTHVSSIALSSVCSATQTSDSQSVTLWVMDASGQPVKLAKLVTTCVYT